MTGRKGRDHGEEAADLLAATAGRTVLLITHRPVDAASVDQVPRIAGGRLEPAA